MKSKKLIIIGNGETAELAYLYFTNDSNYEVVAFAVDREYITNTHLRGLSVVAIEDIYDVYSPNEYEVFVAISSTKLNTLRTRLYRKMKALGYTLASYVSSKAYVGYEVKIGDNCFIMEHSVIQTFAKIGNNVVLWSGSHVGHNSIVHDNCFIAHAVVSGFCEIGESCFVGTNSSIADNVKIGDMCLIGVGCIINKEVPSNSIMKMAYAQKQIITSKQFYGLE